MTASMLHGLDLSEMGIRDLEHLLRAAVEAEQWLDASQIRDELSGR